MRLRIHYLATRILHTNCDEVIRLAATSLSRLLSGSRWLFLISIEGFLELLTCLEDLYLVFATPVCIQEEKEPEDKDQ